jgi:hypothetical protein
MKSKIIQDSQSPRLLTSQTDELDASYRVAIAYASSADSHGDVRKDLHDTAVARERELSPDGECTVHKE